MSLRIRRGTDAQRQAIAFDQGEVVYTTDTKKVYVGDGVTAGGVNILANSAGTGVTFNATTQAFDFSTNNLGLTTSAVSEGANKYFTTQRAQDAAAALFTAVGSPATTGTVAGTVATGTVTLLATPSPLLEQGEKFTVIGTGGGGLTAGGTFFVISNTGTSVVLASSLVNAMTSTAITSLSTASLTGTTFSSAGISTGITFTYDSVTHTLTANSTGLTSLVTDTSPSLGGNLSLNSHSIIGTGTVNITGTITATGIITGSNIDTVGLSLKSDHINSSVTFASYDALANTALNLLVVGSKTVPNTVYINSSNDAGVIVKGISTSAVNSQSIRFATSKGSLVTPTILTTNTSLGILAFDGFDGSTYLNAVAIGATATSVASGVIGGSLTIGVRKTDNSFERFTFTNNGALTAPIFKATGYATGSLPASPEEGFMVFDSTTKQFKGWNGTAWVVLA